MGIGEAYEFERTGRIDPEPKLPAPTLDERAEARAKEAEHLADDCDCKYLHGLRDEHLADAALLRELAEENRRLKAVSIENDDWLTGATIEAVLADGSFRMKNRFGAVKTMTLYRSLPEADLRAQLAQLQATYLAECDRQDTQFQEIERLAGQLAAAEERVKKAEELLRWCATFLAFDSPATGTVNAFLSNLKGGA